MGSVELAGMWQGYHRVSVRGWRRRGEPTWALRDITLQVAPGEMLGVVGGNGSGKTTLLQTIAGVIKPVRGSVRTQGRVASLVDLSAGFHRELTGEENLLFGGVLLGIPRADLRRKFDDIVAFADLPGQALQAPLRTYSAGMGLRLGFALVAHTDPEVLLVDEVLAVGDEDFRAKCVERVAALQQSGTAVVVVSHDLELVEGSCDRAVLLSGGTIDCEGPPCVVIHRYHQLGLTAEADRSARGAVARRRKLL